MKRAAAKRRPHWALLARLPANSRWWGWAALLSSVAVCTAIAFLHARQERVLGRIAREEAGRETSEVDRRSDLELGQLRGQLRREQYITVAATGLALGGLSLGLLLSGRRQAAAIAALAVSDTRYRELIENSGAPIFLKDREGRYQLVNRHWEALTGLHTAEALGRTDRELFPGDEGELFRKNDLAVMQGGGALAFEEVLGEAPETRTFLAVKFPTRDATGAVTGLCGVISEITDRKLQEEARRDSEERYRLVAENMEDVIWKLDVETLGFTYVSPSVQRLRGYSAEEARGQSLEEILTPDSMELVRNLLAQGLAELLAEGDGGRGVTRTTEVEQVRRDGGTVWTETVTTLYQGPDGRLYLQGVSRDITERRGFERDLRRHAAMLREAGELAHVGGWEVNPATGEGFWTEETARIHDVEPGLAMTLTRGISYFEGTDRQRVEEAVAAAITLGTAFDLELELTSAVGRKKWVRAIGQPQVEGGRTIWLRGSMQDVSERKRAEALLAGQNRVLERIARGAPLLATLEELLRVVESFEPEALSAIDLLDAATGRLHPGAAPSLPASYLDATAGLAIGPSAGSCGTAAFRGQPVFVEDVANDPLWADLRSVALEFGVRACWSTPILDEGGRVVGTLALYFREPRPFEERYRHLLTLATQTAAVCIARDRAHAALRENEQRIRRLNADLESRVASRTAQLESANHELEAFSYSVSHDLRAPLRAVDGFSQALVEECLEGLPEVCRGYLRTIRGETQRMGQLIDDLLSFSRLSRVPLAKLPVDTAGLVRSVWKELGAARAGRVVELELAQLPPCLGDVALLRQVWTNLLANALKYTGRREVARVEVGCREEGGAPVFFVRDNGAGFDMRYVSKLFGVFQRLHKAEEYEGTGVGLAIVQRIVHRHGGRVWAEGEPDRGACFSFALPESER